MGKDKKKSRRQQYKSIEEFASRFLPRMCGEQVASSGKLRNFGALLAEQSLAKFKELISAK